MQFSLTILHVALLVLLNISHGDKILKDFWALLLNLMILLWVFFRFFMFVGVLFYVSIFLDLCCYCHSFIFVSLLHFSWFLWEMGLTLSHEVLPSFLCHFLTHWKVIFYSTFYLSAHLFPPFINFNTSHSSSRLPSLHTLFSVPQTPPKDYSSCWPRAVHVPVFL